MNRPARRTRRRLAGASVAATALVALVAMLGAAAPRQPTPPPPTPVPPNGQPSPFPDSLATPSNPLARPTVGARGAILADLDTGHVLFESAPDAPRPVASLTKVMAAVIVLEETELDDVVRVDPRAIFEPGDYGATSVLELRANERVTVRDLLYAVVLGSANDAAVALAIHVDGSEARFVERMNRTARAFGMRRTRFASATGLDDRGRSTPRDLVRLVRVAMDHPSFATIAATRFHTIPAPRGPDRRIQNRNALLWLYPGATGAKTGSTAAAGSCLIATAERDGRRLVAVVLHADGEAFSDAATLLDHGFEGFTERTFVDAGDPQGAVRVRGGTVDAVAGAAFDALVPIRAIDDVRLTVHVDPSAVYPPTAGERIGSIVVSAPGLTLGQVPLVALAPPLPPQPDSTWWLASGRSIADAVGDLVRSLRGG